MRRYFEYQDISTFSLFVTKIAVQKKDGVISVRIVSERPGLIIGKAGRTIDGLRDHLKDAFQCEVKISLTESNIWS